MAEFLNTTDTSARLEQIIRDAEQILVLVSPFVQLSPRLFDNLKSADKRRVKITLVYGKRELKPDERERLETLDNLSLYFREDLHAKCYYNEKQMIITSMNLCDFSERKNDEMGILLEWTREPDKTLCDAAVKEVSFILDRSKVVKKSRNGLPAIGKKVMGVVNGLLDDVIGTSKKGFCIRCRGRIELNRNPAYCADCNTQWAVRKNWTLQEKYCHQCGEQLAVTPARPSCKACYESKPRNRLPTGAR